MLRVRAAGHAPLVSAEHPAPAPLGRRRPSEASGRFTATRRRMRTAGAGALDQAAASFRRHGHEFRADDQERQQCNADGARSSSHRGRWFDRQEPDRVCSECQKLYSPDDDLLVWWSGSPGIT